MRRGVYGAIRQDRSSGPDKTLKVIVGLEFSIIVKKYHK
jgi:hypothetical protein